MIPLIHRIPLVQNLLNLTDRMSSNTSSNSSIYDVFKVRHILRWKVTKDGLPLEIVDLIIDAAEYWPWTETNMEEKTVIQQDLDQELLRSLPLCFDKKVCHPQVYLCPSDLVVIKIHSPQTSASPDRPPLSQNYLLHNVKRSRFRA